MRFRPLFLPMNATNTTKVVCEEQLGPGFTSVGLVFLFLIIFLSILGNTLVCVAVSKFSYLQTYSNYFVFSLAVSDVMVSATVVPFDIVYWISFPVWPLGGYVCNLWNSLFFLFLTASVLNLLAISTDRFIAVVYALRYKELIHVTFVKIIIVSIWLYSVTIGLTVFFVLVPPQTPVYTFDINPSLHAFLLVGNVFIPFLVMIVLYFKIYLIAREHARRVGIVAINPSSLTLRNVIGRELRVAKALGIVLTTFVLCWLPFEIINVVILIDEEVESCGVELADTVSCWLAYVQTSLNPIIYALSNAEFRRAFRRIVCWSKSDPSGMSTVNSTNKDINQSVEPKEDQPKCSEDKSRARDNDG